MCGFVREVLNTIKEPFYCAIDGALQEYENGVVAGEALDGILKTSHAIKLIDTKDSKICVTIVDCQPEIDESNKIWMAEEKKERVYHRAFSDSIAHTGSCNAKKGDNENDRQRTNNWL